MSTRMFKSVSFALLVAFVCTLSGCGNKGIKYFNKGIRGFEKEEYSNAIENFLQAKNYKLPLDKKKMADLKLAESYRISNRLHEAEKFYKQAIEEGTADEHAYFYYGYAQKANGNYLGAEASFKEYVQNGTNFEFIDRAKTELKNLKALREISNHTSAFKIENFKALNTDVLDYSPMMHGKELYFTSSRGEGILFPGQGTRFTDIFVYRFDGPSTANGQVVGNIVPAFINQDNTHEASATFTDKGKTMVFARSNDGKKENPTQVVDLFITYYKGGVWTEPERLPFNETNNWDSSPCFSPDGKYLYYSSDREGGEGSNDIWRVERFEDSSWSEPENLGKPINTNGEDVFPYIAPDGTMYFSSDGHVGFGGLDLFVVRNKNRKRTVENLGKPLNSSYDDFAITFRSNQLGFFTSNRPDGKGMDDIYMFNLEIRQFLEVVVTGRKLDDHFNITKAEKILKDATVQVYDVADDKLVKEAVTDETGKIKFEVQPDHQYYIVGTKPEYVTGDTLFSMVGRIPTEAQVSAHKDIVYKTKVILDPKILGKKIELAPIYYPYDKWNITDSAANVLDTIVTILKANPQIVIELGSHTDPRNTFKYNDLLSQKRAQSAVEYILSHGISKDRIYPRGYGERVPNVLSKDVGALKKGTELTHEYILSIKDLELQALAYALDRRTEFTIVKVLPKKYEEGSTIEVIDHHEKEKVIEDKKVKYEEMLYNRLKNRDK